MHARLLPDVAENTRIHFLLVSIRRSNAFPAVKLLGLPILQAGELGEHFECAPVSYSCRGANSGKNPDSVNVLPRMQHAAAAASSIYKKVKSGAVQLMEF